MTEVDPRALLAATRAYAEARAALYRKPTYPSVADMRALEEAANRYLALAHPAAVAALCEAHITLLAGLIADFGTLRICRVCGWTATEGRPLEHGRDCPLASAASAALEGD